MPSDSPERGPRTWQHHEKQLMIDAQPACIPSVSSPSSSAHAFRTLATVALPYVRRSRTRRGVRTGRPYDCIRALAR